MNKIALDDIAGIFGVHPRTILRAMGEKDSSHWAHPEVDLAQVALAYGIPINELTIAIKNIRNDKDALMSIKKTAEFIAEVLDGSDVSVHVIRRRYPKFIWTAGVIRYLQSHVIDYYIEHSA